MVAYSANRDRHHRHGRPRRADGGIQRQPVIGLLRQFTACRRSSSSPSAVAYSACMRSHGVSSFPDPDSSGALPKGAAQHFGVSSSQLQATERACQSLLPNTGSFDQQFSHCVSSGDCPPALVQQAMTLMRSFAQCMRTDGVPNFPDPTIGGGGAPFFNASGAGLSNQYTHSAAFRSKADECSSRVGGSTGVPVPMR
jgi:hypothetical protein